MNQIKLLVSEKQLLAIQTFFGGEVEDMLYGGAARGGKSETIGIILAIVLSAFPGSSWLIARTILADLKATTLNTFYKVIKRFGYGDKSYRDRIRDERHIEFVNGSKLYVIQVNLEPSDPEFDRIGSYGYTGGFLDEGQQMSNKVREVLQGRLSELDGSFSTEVDMSYSGVLPEDMNAGYEIIFQVVGETTDPGENPTKDFQYIGKELSGAKMCHIVREEKLTIPYKLIEAKVVNGKLIHTYGWHFNGCIFTGCNPGTNFTRSEFYKPWKSGDLPPYMSFIPAKVNDNPWVDTQYITRLERLPETSIRKQRLLYGNFDFDDSPAILFDQNTIEKVFDREYDGDKTLYIVVDAARQGKDKTEIGLWEGLHLKEIITIEEGSLVKQAEKIEMLASKHGINMDENVLVDEVGVGGGLVDMLGCKGFIGNSQALQPFASKYLKYKKRNYANLRSQAFYYLQRYLPEMSITCSMDVREQIIEELLTVKEADVENDSKLQIVKKSLMKEELGRSPDLADLLSMRMYFLIDEHHRSESSDGIDTTIDTPWEIEEKKLNTFLSGFSRPELKREDDIGIGAF